MNPLRRADTFFRDHPVLTDALVACLLVASVPFLATLAIAPVNPHADSWTLDKPK